MRGKKKGNVDSDIIFDAMKRIYKNESFEKVILVSGDGNYKKLVDFLIEEGRFEKILFPNETNKSSLYNKIGGEYFDSLSGLDIRKKYKKRRGLLRHLAVRIPLRRDDYTIQHKYLPSIHKLKAALTGRLLVKQGEEDGGGDDDGNSEGEVKSPAGKKGAFKVSYKRDNRDEGEGKNEQDGESERKSKDIQQPSDF